MRNFILGTDWWTDCDDAVALRILARAHKAGEISLKAIGINACMEHSVTSLEGFLNSEDVRDVPIGIDLEGTDFGGKPPYQKRLSSLKEKYNSNVDAEDAVRLYRRTLAEARDPVEIIEIGFLQVIANVLQSEADDLSPLSGIELVKQKVKKLWVMAGKWDEPDGKENNFARNARARVAAAAFCKLCPVPVTFLGWEVSFDVITGGVLPKGDVLYNALCDFGRPEGRSSWDPMLVLLAVVGEEAEAGYDVVRGVASVEEESGVNHFSVDENGLHAYVVKNQNNDYYVNEIHKRII